MEKIIAFSIHFAARRQNADMSFSMKYQMPVFFGIYAIVNDSLTSGTGRAKKT
jgi:hypothetical protein